MDSDYLEKIINSILLENYNVQFGKIESVKVESGEPLYASVQPLFKSSYEDDEEGQTAPAIINDVPVFILGTQSFSINVIPEKGSIVVLLVSDRALKPLIESLDVVDPGDPRFNNLNDAIAIPIQFYPSVKEGVLQIKSNSGSEIIEMSQNSTSIFSNSIVLNGPVSVKGKLDVDKDITTKTGTVSGFEVTATGAKVKLSTHVHPTAATGPASPPTPGT